MKSFNILSLLVKQNRKITSFDVSIFLRQLATLISAGIPIIKSFEILEKSQLKISFRLLIFSIKREILSGKDLFSSLHQHQRYFDELTCQLIKIGEHTGKLETILLMIADTKEKNLMLKKRVSYALLYPCIITITAVLVTLSMLIFVIPQFAILFSDTHIQLPTLTRCIFFLSLQIQHHWIMLFSPLLLSLCIFMPVTWFDKLKKYLSDHIIKLPLIHPFLLKITLARFARTLAMTFAAGMPITSALKLLMHAGHPREFTYLIVKLHSNITSGLQLHQAMGALPYFPDLMTQMVKIGEESGMLDQLLNKVASFFEADIDQTINHFSQLLEPLIMLMLGVLIGGLVIGMYLPIFKLGNVL
jgi:type IV pilus assembly protein PilC